MEVLEAQKFGCVVCSEQVAGGVVLRDGEKGETLVVWKERDDGGWGDVSPPSLKQLASPFLPFPQSNPLEP